MVDGNIIMGKVSILNSYMNMMIKSLPISKFEQCLIWLVFILDLCHYMLLYTVKVEICFIGD